MSHQSDLIAEDIDAYLAEHERKEILRFLTCGSVDETVKVAGRRQRR